MAKEPLHKKISDELRLNIQDGKLAVDEKIPSENELCEHYDVSRLTVRRSLQTLEQEGLIYRCQGLGAFVKDTQGTQQMVHLTDFEDDMIGAGLVPSSLVLRNEVVSPSDEILEKLKLKSGTKVYRLDRLRLGNDKPIAFDTTWLPMMYGQLIADVDLETTTIYKVLESEYQIEIRRGRIFVEAALPLIEQAKALDVNPGHPLLKFRRYSYTVNDKLVYYQERLMRSDRMSYEIDLFRNDEDQHDSHLPLKHMLPVFRD